MSDTPGLTQDSHLDPETAMREMMGFSSFSVRRPKSLSNTSPMQVPPHGTDQRDPAPDAEGSSDISAFNPRQGFKSIKSPGDERQPSILSHPSSSSIRPSAQQQTTYAFTSPQTGISYTSEELEQWSRGKTNERGDKVFFKPGFVSDDPWFRLRNTGKGGDNYGGNRERGNSSQTHSA